MKSTMDEIACLLQDRYWPGRKPRGEVAGAAKFGGNRYLFWNGCQELNPRVSQVRVIG